MDYFDPEELKYFLGVPHIGGSAAGRVGGESAEGGGVWMIKEDS